MYYDLVLLILQYSVSFFTATNHSGDWICTTMVLYLEAAAISTVACFDLWLLTHDNLFFANIGAFFASIWVVWINAKLDVYFFNRHHSRSRFEKRVANHFVPCVVAFYGIMVLIPWSVTENEIIRAQGQPLEIFLRRYKEFAIMTIKVSSRLLETLAVFSSIFRIIIPYVRAARARERWILLGMLLNMLVLKAFVDSM